MDWEKVDLTLEGHIGGEEHPNMPWHIRQYHNAPNRLFPFSDVSDLYLALFRTDRNGILMIVDDHELGREPIILRRQEEEARRCVSDGGEGCDRCGVQVNIINRSRDWGCCDNCEREMNEEMAADPDVVFAFDRGGLRAVA